MDHPAMVSQVDQLLDGELAAADAGAVESHLADCGECAAYRERRLALRAALREALPRIEVPARLRQRIEADLRRAAAATEPRRRVPAGWQWLALAASLMLVAVGGWQAGLRQGQATAMADEVLRSHVRSLMPGHLTDVASTDQHTVKPWFAGVLDYSPPVHDFVGRGYPLLGGRLDYIGDRTVATLVYGRRKHLISVMVWPASRGSAGGGAVRSQRGYHQLHWSTSEYTYWATSDLGLAELTEFRGLIQQADSVSRAATP